MRVRAFARACGYEAKTDPLEARVLARDGQVFPASDPCPSENEEEREALQQRLLRRRQRVDQRIQERNRLDKEYQTLLQRSAALRPQAALYRSVPGVGALTAAMLVAFLPELGQRDSKALFAGGARTVVAGQWPQTRPAVGPPCAKRCTWRPCP